MAIKGNLKKYLKIDGRWQFILGLKGEIDTRKRRMPEKLRVEMAGWRSSQ